MKKILLSLTALCAVILVNAQTQPPNAGFETWGSSLGEPQEPTGWVSENVLASPLLTTPNPNPNPTSVTQYTPAQTGSFSCQVVTKVITYNPAYPALADTMGALILGKVSTSSPYLLAGIAYTDRPNTFSFESMYTPVGSDSAWAYVALTKWTGSSRSIIASNYSDIPPSATWMPRSFTLNYLSTTVVPDTLQITFYSSSLKRHSMMPGSTLVLDALAFSGYMGVNEYQNIVKFNTYPNPAGSVLNINTDAKKVEMLNVYDITGKVVQTLNITADHTVVNTESFNAGMYFYCATNKAGETLARGKFNVAR